MLTSPTSLLLVSFVCVALCAGAQTKSTDPDVAAIRKAIDQFIASYNTGRVDDLLKVYSADFVDMSQGEHTLRGRNAIDDTAQRIRDTFRKFNPHLEVDTEEIIVSGDYAFDRGELTVSLTPKAGGDPVIVKRRFLEVWRKESNGEWRVIRAMDNAVSEHKSLDFRESP